MNVERVYVIRQFVLLFGCNLGDNLFDSCFDVGNPLLVDFDWNGAAEYFQLFHEVGIGDLQGSLGLSFKTYSVDPIHDIVRDQGQAVVVALHFDQHVGGTL